MSRKYFYCCLFFLLPNLYFLSLPISVGDLAIWIAQGKYFLETDHLLRHDIFSVLPTRDLIYPVGSSILYAWIHQWAGLNGVVIFDRLVVLFVSYLWYRGALAKMKAPWSLPTAIVVLLAWFGTSLLFTDRPALLALVPFVMSFQILQKEEELSARDLGVLVLLEILWVNLHGSWPLLPLLLVWREGTRWRVLHRRLRPLSVLAPFLVLAASLVNPFGVAIFPYVIETARISKERGIIEWAPTFSALFPAQSFAFALLLILFGIWSLKVKKDNPVLARLLLTSPFVLLLLIGFESVRQTLWAFAVLIPFAGQFRLLAEERFAEKPVRSWPALANIIIVVAIAAFSILLLPPFKSSIAAFLPKNKRAVYDSSAPFAVAEYLRGTVDRDPVFNDWEYGSFLALAQPHRIFLDARNIIFEDKDFQDCLNLVEMAPGWESILAKYRVRYLVLNKQLHGALLSALKSSGKWVVLSEDENTTLLGSKGGF